MRSRSRRAYMALMLPLSLGEVSAQAPQPPVFAAATQAIYIDVTLERAAADAPRLAAPDFRLFDNGVPQAFELMSAADLPVRAILAFDTSASMKGPKLDQLSRAAQDFVSRLGPKDEATLLTFSTGFEWSGPPQPDISRVQASLRNLQAEGATSLYDALYSALVLPGAGSRVLVVLFSDGADTSSWLTDAKIRAFAERANALIHVVALPDRGQELVASPAAAYLQTLREVAESTGGSLVTVQSAQQIGRAFNTILENVRARYVLRYDPATTPSPGWHKLEVRLAPGRKERVRARSGYWVR